jgi:dsRNA-specific ribonuclease
MQAPVVIKTETLPKKTIEQQLGYVFNQPTLLQQALTRKSAIFEKKQAENIGHNERLEFFGDSILRTVIDDILMQLYPAKNEDFLSQERDVLVSKGGFLYTASESIGLSQWIIMGEGEAQNCQGQGRKKILSSVMEAIIGAIFIDSGRNYDLMKRFIAKHAGLEKRLLEVEQDELDLKLFHAVEKNNLEQVKHCLSKHANLQKMHEFSYSVSCPCCFGIGSLPSWVEIGGSSSPSSTVLDLAIRRSDGFNENSLEMIQLLLEHKANPNPDSKFKYSLLHETLIFYPKRKDDAKVIFPKIFKLLCENGANLDKRDKLCCDGKPAYTPLELAIINANFEAVKLLLQHGANPNSRNKFFQTPLHFAAMYSQVYYKQFMQKDSFFHDSTINYLNIYSDIVKTLLDYKANPRLTDANQKTPWELATALRLKKLLKVQPQNQHELTTQSQSTKYIKY